VFFLLFLKLSLICVILCSNDEIAIGIFKYNLEALILSHFSKIDGIEPVQCHKSVTKPSSLPVVKLFRVYARYLSTL